MRRDERGLSTLEWIGLLGLIAVILAMIPFVRETVQDLVGVLYDRRDDAGELTDFSVIMRGVTITLAAVAVFIGSAWLVLATDVGTRLSFLVVGVAAFGWLTISGIMFVVYAPRGIRPSDIDRIISICQCVEQDVGNRCRLI